MTDSLKVALIQTDLIWENPEHHAMSSCRQVGEKFISQGRQSVSVNNTYDPVP